uniref:Uncharacterized protein n=1 Tax=Oryza glumipatula TaxID=40148 RepID=A0A0E0AU46_9ORYZ
MATTSRSEGDDVDVVMDGLVHGVDYCVVRAGTKRISQVLNLLFHSGTRNFQAQHCPCSLLGTKGPALHAVSLEAPRFLSSRAGVRDKVEARRISRAEEIHEPLVQGVGEEVPLSHSDLNRNAEWPCKLL